MNAQERPTIQQLRNAYDAEMKNILTNKRVLANILVGCTDEFTHCDVEDVIAMSFNTTPTYGNTSVEEDTSTAELAAKLTGGEHATLTEGKVVYDTRFEVCVPNTNTPSNSSLMSRGSETLIFSTFSRGAASTMRHDSSHRKRERSSKTTTITQSKKSTPFEFAPIRPKKLVERANDSSSAKKTLSENTTSIPYNTIS